jgi:hypothetical protein
VDGAGTFFWSAGLLAASFWRMMNSHGHSPGSMKEVNDLHFRAFRRVPTNTTWTKEPCMFRARLASLTLAAGLLALSGCNTCGPGFHLFNRQQHTDCGCSQPCGQPVVVGSAPSFEGPTLVPQDTGAPMPATSPPPRIVPVPANPVPYTPTGLRRLFDRTP